MSDIPCPAATVSQSRVPQALAAFLRTAAFGALAWVVIASWPQLRLALATLSRADKSLVLVAIGWELVALALVASTYRAALASAGARVGFRQAGGVALRAGAVSRLVPGGGAAAALFAMRRLRSAGVPDGPAVAGVAVNGILTMAMLASVVAVGSGSAVGVASLWAVAAAGVIIAVGRPRARDRLGAFATRLRARRELATVGAAVATVAERPLRTRSLSVAACSAAAAWCCELAALWFVVAAVAEPLPLPTVAMGLGAANLAAALPHTPGGVGVVEVAVTAAFVATGADARLALAGVLGYRAIGFWLPALTGLILLAADRLGRRDRSSVAVRSVTS